MDTFWTLAERWNGASWKIQATPSPSGGNLLAVSCTSATACTAVGGVGGALAERWDGMNWTVQPAPVDLGNEDVYGVSCASARACTAVGDYETSYGVLVTSAEFWNGTFWTTQSTPNPSGALGSILFGVSCTSDGACTAVGFASINGLEVTLAERYSG
jgi:hypothetical protein